MQSCVIILYWPFADQFLALGTWLTSQPFVLVLVSHKLLILSSGYLLWLGRTLLLDQCLCQWFWLFRQWYLVVFDLLLMAEHLLIGCWFPALWQQPKKWLELSRPSFCWIFGVCFCPLEHELTFVSHCFHLAPGHRSVLLTGRFLVLLGFGCQCFYSLDLSPCSLHSYFSLDWCPCCIRRKTF